MINKVYLSKRAEKDLEKVPSYIAKKLELWVEHIEHFGLENVRKRPSYHDEPLQGERFGQRSISLSRSYRAIYRKKKDDIEFILIEEVNKHDY